MADRSTKRARGARRIGPAKFKQAGSPKGLLPGARTSKYDPALDPHDDRFDRWKAEAVQLRAALDALWTVVLNDVPCSAERACGICGPVYEQVRKALNG